MSGVNKGGVDQLCYDIMAMMEEEVTSEEVEKD